MNNIYFDTLFDIFNNLNSYHILSYLRTNKNNYNIINMERFERYILNNRRINNIYNINILKVLYIYEKNYYDIWNDEILEWGKNIIINKYFHKMDILRNLSNDNLFKLLTITYPNPTVSPFLFTNRYLLSKRAISLNYTCQDVIGLFIKESVSFYHGIKYCFKYDREDVLQECFKIMVSKGNTGSSYLGTIKISNLSNYLTHTKDVKDSDILKKLQLYSGINVFEYSITPELLIHSRDPITLFNKYKQTFLNNEEFRDGYNGNVDNTTNNYIGHILSYTLGNLSYLDKSIFNTNDFNFIVFCYRLGCQEFIQHVNVRIRKILKLLNDKQLFRALDILTEQLNIEGRDIFYNSIACKHSKKPKLWNIIYILHRLDKYNEGLDDLVKSLWWKK
ncbi:Hypothetical protein ORPV_77 [Orpheovirus IHUMI-LCC2]|uniref:Uncharacterized protein n=1 Tax=Orpheovirus IHUMI-LCC2 TaxID=2023057 RepID=A0A2I2L377_9VIRU|nr:Hypothetical protein ORPV_77 [Orpheovirus IHUMI-LCC2]SNW61981.1 Hypothetical protein ORPV_77 [Orpheovirus IHUMI-LCC2]